MADRAPEGVRPASITAAGGVLLVFGAVEGLIGFLFLMLGALFGSSDSLPDWVMTDPAGGAGVPRLLLMGVGVIVFAVIQMLTAVAILRGGRQWAQLAGIAFALAGAGMCLVAMLPRPEAPTVNLVFVPLVVTFGLVALALALGGSWLSGGAGADQQT